MPIRTRGCGPSRSRPMTSPQSSLVLPASGSTRTSSRAASGQLPGERGCRTSASRSKASARPTAIFGLPGRPPSPAARSAGSRSSRWMRPGRWYRSWREGAPALPVEPAPASTSSSGFRRRGRRGWGRGRPVAPAPLARRSIRARGPHPATRSRSSAAGVRLPRHARQPEGRRRSCRRPRA